MEIRNVLITGGAGYIGSLLCEKLLEKNHNVYILDNFNFGIEPVKKFTYDPSFKIFYGDIRQSEDLKKSIKNMDAVIHLAGIVGDPACAVRADTAVEVNYESTKNLVNLVKKSNIKKFIFASTCSVYGASEDKILDEESELNPVSLYGETKVDAEKSILKLMDENFKPTILRFGTIYGLSNRMRFDLAINFLTQKLLLEKKGKIFGGSQWRPFVHVRDIVKCLMLVLNSKIEKTGGEIFNVGVTDENYRMNDVGKIFEEVFPDSNIDYVKEVKDKRSYRVSFDKVKNQLNFSNDFKVVDGILEIKDAVEKGIIKDPSDSIYRNYKP